MDVYKQKFLILGVSKSGFSAAEYLLRLGAKVYFIEEQDSPKIQNAIEILLSKSAIRVSKEESLAILDKIDVLVISPGVPINHEIAVVAKRKGIRIIGEMELGFLSFFPMTVAITGTNGKTTTVSMIDWVLKGDNKDSIACGNIGVPITSILKDGKKDTIYVAEISSFQLESIKSFCPHIACILNITPNHLDRHYSFENYVFLKKRLLFNLTESEYAVLNYDDEVVRTFIKDTKAKPIWVSVKERVFGAYLLEENLYFKDKLIMNVNELTDKSIHNVFNALTCIAVCSLLGVEGEIIKERLKTFKGVKHRCEKICEKNGKTFVNDSKSTNTASTISAIKAIKNPTVLILGGSEKGENYEKLFLEIKQSLVKHVILTGKSKLKMLDTAGKVGYQDLTITSNFDDAIKIASLLADSGDTVLLSPACASFDNFSDFEERGDRFRKIVESLS